MTCSSFVDVLLNIIVALHRSSYYLLSLLLLLIIFKPITLLFHIKTHKRGGEPPNRRSDRHT